MDEDKRRLLEEKLPFQIMNLPPVQEIGTSFQAIKSWDIRPFDLLLKKKKITISKDGFFAWAADRALKNAAKKRNFGWWLNDVKMYAGVLDGKHYAVSFRYGDPVLVPFQKHMLDRAAICRPFRLSFKPPGFREFVLCLVDFLEFFASAELKTPAEGARALLDSVCDAGTLRELQGQATPSDFLSRSDFTLHYVMEVE